MSRTLIGGVVAVVLFALTGLVYFMTTRVLEDRIRRDVYNVVTRAQSLLTQQADLEALTLLKKTQALALDPRFAAGGATAEQAIKEFRADLKVTERRPDVVSVVDRQGQLLILFAGGEAQNPVRDLYLSGNELKYPSIRAAMESPQAISEVWDYESIGPVKATVAPIVQPDSGEVTGALLVLYAITAKEAEDQKRLLGAHVAYFFGDRIFATSFGSTATQMRASLAKPLFEGGMAKAAMTRPEGFSDIKTFELGSAEYVATAIKLPRRKTGELPAEIAHPPGGAMVLASITEGISSIHTVKLAIALFGFASLVIALVTMMVTAKSILGPLDEIEVGVNEIINGNVDRAFHPVSRDVDGLANALNVMLARLLGRPEPGDEEFDDTGKLFQPGAGSAMTFDAESLSPKDAEAMRLAREPEEEYLQRVFREFLDARQRAGESNSGITRESFAAKLRLSEATMKEKYQCSTVRFKVVTKDGKVTLKPVPIV